MPLLFSLTWFFLFAGLSGGVVSSAFGQSLPQDARELYQQSHEILAEGNSNRALDLVQEGIRQFPGELKLQVLQGEILSSLRENDLAIRAFEEALHRDSHFKPARWAKWALYIRQGNRNGAILELIQLQRIDPENPLLPLRLAHELRKMDRLDEALIHYRKAVHLAPRQVGWRLYLARALYDVLDYESAQREVERILQEVKTGSRLEMAARSLYGVVHGQTTDKGRRSMPFPNAQESGATAKRWALLREEAWAHMREGRYHRAEIILKGILRMRSTDHRAAYDLGKTLMELERYEEAIETFSDGIRLSPDGAIYPDSLFRIGQCLTYLDRWDEAYSYFLELEQISDWRHESTYAMTFPDEEQIAEWLLRTKAHVSLPRNPVPLSRGKPPAPPHVLDAGAPHFSGNATNPMADHGISPRMALMGRDSDFSWFRHIIPAQDVIRDDMQAGAHEFLPLSSGDTIEKAQQDVYLVFGLALSSYDEILLSAECYVEDPARHLSAKPVSRDQVIAGASEQSGYFLLSAPEGGWAPGLYRVDLFVGDTIAASTQVDEVRFRVLP